MSRIPLEQKADTEQPEKKRGRAKTRPVCYGCNNRARPDSIFCSDKCGCAYADQLVGLDAGNDQEWCPECDKWEEPDGNKPSKTLTTTDDQGNVISRKVERFLVCGHKSSGKTLYKGKKEE